MGGPELLALSLGLSIAVAALTWAGGGLLERLSADPRLRDRVWAAALILPALPPLAVGLLLLTPAPVRDLPLAAASLPTTVVAASAETVAVAPQTGFVFEPTLAAWAVLGVAALLAFARLAALALRTRRLARVIREAEAPDAEVAAMVDAAARGLAVLPPRVAISATAPEALLAGPVRTRLILPAGLMATGAAPAVIAHELAHLKRGDHRTLWLEEALLALLAANPLLPVLRARRAAAREEACDALALGDAAPETRRAYARSLIDALRSRAAPQGLPALTFTGAGRTQAMNRLKAVMNPVPAANHGLRLTAVALGGLIAALAGAGSLAVAAEREAVIRMQPAPAQEPRVVDAGAEAAVLLNGAPLPAGLPMWAISADRIDVRTAEAGPGEVNFILAFTGATPVSVNGRRMPEGFPASGVNPDAVARVEIVDDHVMYTLKPETDVRRARRQAEATPTGASVRQAIGSDRSRLTPEQQARYRNPTGAGYHALCASSDPADGGFCAGVIFAQFPQGPGGSDICLPAELEQGDETARRAALGMLVDRTKAEIARASIQPGDHPADVARSALTRAYPCDTAPAEAFRASAARLQTSVPLTVTVDIDGRPLSVRGDETLRVVLTDENGAVMNTMGTLNDSGRASGTLAPLSMAIAAE